MPFWKWNTKQADPKTPKTKTYYIVELRHVGQPVWWAYNDTRATRKGNFNSWDTVTNTVTFKGADDCERLLRATLRDGEFQNRIVRRLDI